MDYKEFNECMDELKNLEHILITNGKFTETQIVENKLKIMSNYNIIDEKQAELYVESYHLYLMKKIEESDYGNI